MQKVQELFKVQKVQTIQTVKKYKKLQKVRKVQKVQKVQKKKKIQKIQKNTTTKKTHNLSRYYNEIESLALIALALFSFKAFMNISRELTFCVTIICSSTIFKIKTMYSLYQTHVLVLAP